jgi:hypothetical protein
MNETFSSPTFKFFQNVILNQPTTEIKSNLKSWNLEFSKFYHQVVNPVPLTKKFIESIELFYGFPNKNRMINDLNLLFFPISILNDKRNIQEWNFENFNLPITSFEEIKSDTMNLKNILDSQNLISSELLNILNSHESKFVRFKSKKSSKEPLIRRLKLNKENGKYEILYSKEDEFIPLDLLCNELHERIGFTYEEWFTLFLLDEKKALEEYNKKYENLHEILNEGSTWIDFMKFLLTYFDDEKSLNVEVEESLEILNHFRNKLIKNSHYDVDFTSIKLLIEKEILLLSKSIHILNVQLEDHGGIFYFFGKLMIEDIKYSMIFKTKFKDFKTKFE